MANSGKDTNLAQFFITTSTTSLDHLDGKYVVFGRVVKGEDVVTQVENVPVDSNGSPIEPVQIEACGQVAEEDVSEGMDEEPADEENEEKMSETVL
jgi:cyclophilin family peptidyl-prolyl cis-trans isomerase